MKLSIIIPAFNAESTIIRAVDSALNAFNAAEVIVVDDGSTDNTGELLDEYSKGHQELKVIHIKNQGVSYARNLGINNSSNEYIMFMDADDEILFSQKTNIEKIMESKDMIIFSFIEKKMNGKKCASYSFEDSYIECDNIADCFLNNKYSFYGPWSKVFRKTIIQKYNLEFNLGQKYGEDVVFVLKYLSNINKGIYLSSEICYLHYINPNGASYYNKYYREMNVYLFEQLKAFEKLVDAHVHNKDKNAQMINDFSAELFNETVYHYYLRTDKDDFLKMYAVAYNTYSSYLKIDSLRKCSLFKRLNIGESELTNATLSTKVYSANWYYKFKFACKKLLYRFL